MAMLFSCSSSGAAQSLLVDAPDGDMPAQHDGPRRSLGEIRMVAKSGDFGRRMG